MGTSHGSISLNNCHSIENDGIIFHMTDYYIDVMSCVGNDNMNKVVIISLTWGPKTQENVNAPPQQQKTWAHSMVPFH